VPASGTGATRSWIATVRMRSGARATRESQGMIDAYQSTLAKQQARGQKMFYLVISAADIDKLYVVA